VVINAAGPRLVDAWIELPNVKAVLNAGLLGEQSGHAIMDVIFGDVNPSGRLPYTIAKTTEDYNGKICPCCECKYDEGLFIDYRHFDKSNITPRYEFGFGLSYTTFSYKSLVVSQTGNSTQKGNSTATTTAYASGPVVEGGLSSLFNTVATVTVTISNTGPVVGKEVVQLYLGFPASANAPAKQLRGFQKIELEAGQSKTITFALQRRDLSTWDTVKQNWKLESGKFNVYVSSSSRKSELEGSLDLIVN